MVTSRSTTPRSRVLRRAALAAGVILSTFASSSAQEVEGDRTVRLRGVRLDTKDSLYEGRIVLEGIEDELSAGVRGQFGMSSMAEEDHRDRDELYDRTVALYQGRRPESLPETVEVPVHQQAAPDVVGTAESSGGKETAFRVMLVGAVLLFLFLKYRSELLREDRRQRRRR